jgi:predicted nucleic acid-binding protein
VILFADTSALIKLYIEEVGSAAMAERARNARMAHSVLAYAEIYSTFARRLRETLLIQEEHDELAERFEHDWQGVIVVALQPALVGRVPRLVRDHPLRGADAVHLASALTLREAGLELAFAVADGRLVEAAAREGLEVFDPERATG